MGAKRGEEFTEEVDRWWSWKKWKLRVRKWFVIVVRERKEGATRRWHVRFEVLFSRWKFWKSVFVFCYSSDTKSREFEGILWLTSRVVADTWRTLLDYVSLSLFSLFWIINKKIPILILVPKLVQFSVNVCNVTC